MVEIRNKPETNSERCYYTVNILYFSLRTVFWEWHGFRIIVWHFSFLLCSEVSQTTSDVSVSVVKSAQDRYKSKSDEKPCVIIESGARSTRLVDMALVSVNRGCSRKLVAVALFHEDLVGKQLFIWDLFLHALLLYEPVLYSLQGLLFLFRLHIYDNLKIPSEMFRKLERG